MSHLVSLFRGVVLLTTGVIGTLWVLHNLEISKEVGDLRTENRRLGDKVAALRWCVSNPDEECKW